LAGRLSEDPAADLCYAKVLAFDGCDSAHPHAEPWRPFVPWPRIIEPLTALCAIHGSAALMRRRVFEKFGFLPEDRKFQGCEDWHFWLSLALGGARIVYVPSVLALYRQHLRSSSSSRLGVAARESTLVRAMVSMFAARGLDDFRSRQFLALGVFGTALRCLPLCDRASISSLTELAQGLAPTGSAAADAVKLTVDPKRACYAWRRIAEAYLALGAPELAAIGFSRFWPPVSEPLPVGLDAVFSAMADLVRAEVAILSSGDASYLGHTARQLAQLSHLRSDAEGRETYLRWARRLDPNDPRNDIRLVAALAGRRAYSEATRVLARTLMNSPRAVARAGLRAVVSRLRRWIE
jgi:hypothetical protein